MEIDRIQSLKNALIDRLHDFEKFMNQGVSNAEILETENLFGHEFSETYKSLLEEFNGEAIPIYMMGGLQLMSLKQAEIQWQLFLARDRTVKPSNRVLNHKVQPLLYHQNRFPFAHDGSGNFLCMDYYPNIKGKMGQIIFLSTVEEKKITEVADSFECLINRLTECVRGGNIAIVDERSKWSKEDWHMAEVYFQNNWQDNWETLSNGYQCEETMP